MRSTALRSGAQRIVAGLEAAHVTLAASVPDTWIGRLMGVVRASAKIRAVDAAREEEAVAIACGASLAGGRGAVLIQNAGLFNRRAFDPKEPIPPYSERPDEIRARFQIA